MLELSGKDFKEAIMKMIQWAIMNMLETNDRKSQQRNKSNRKEPNAN